MFNINDAYKEYADMVFKFLMSLCGDKEVAEELTQETFYRAIKSSGRYDGSCKVSTWLCQIAKHVWYQEVEKNKRRKTARLSENIPDKNGNIEEELCLIEDKMQLMKAVHILSEPSKEIILLRITGAFSFKEIGEIFNKSETWARVTFYRAKQKIMKGRIK